MQNLQVIEARGIRVLTTKQIAAEYETEEWKIKQNFQNNQKRYIEGKHYICLKGDELREFKNKVENFYPVGKTANKLYLWTEKGALLHAKSLNTDKAWEVYDYLVDFYFRAKEKGQPKEVITSQRIREVVDVPNNPIILNSIQKVQNDLICMNVFLEECKKHSSKEMYRIQRRSAAEVVEIIMRDMSRLLELEPKSIQEQY